jgi:hypothetical protein
MTDPIERVLDEFFPDKPNQPIRLQRPDFPTSPEQAEILGHFVLMLDAATKDGGRKRMATKNPKPSWKVDPSHEAAIFSHLNKWKHGEKRDQDSGVHPLIHCAWRCLAIAWQETNRAG